MTAPAAANPSEPLRLYVWDSVVRLCHLVFIGGCLGAYLTYQTGLMQWHAWCGYAVLGALAARLIWALIGSPNARFSGFVAAPAKVWAYVRHWRTQPPPVGHNPLGGYAVIALLATLLVQTVTGLFSDDEVSVAGPLRGLVNDDQAQGLTHLHALAFDALLGLIGLHLAAIAAYALVKRVNLVGAMVTGWKKVAAPKV